MVIEDTGLSSLSGMFADFSTKLKDTEERLNILKERLSLLNRTFLMEGERINSEFTVIKNSLRQLGEESEKIKDGLEHIIKESAGFARKEELQALERYMKLWDPLRNIMEKDKSVKQEK